MLVIPVLGGGDKSNPFKVTLGQPGLHANLSQKIKWNKIYNSNCSEAHSYPVGSSGAPTKKPLLGDNLALSFKKKKNYSKQVMQGTQKKKITKLLQYHEKMWGFIDSGTQKSKQKAVQLPRHSSRHHSTTVWVHVQVQFCPHPATASSCFSLSVFKLLGHVK